MPIRLCLLIVLTVFVRPTSAQVGRTEIMKWPDGKKGAVSITFDDGSLNQFRVAAPILDSLRLPATFFIVTGQIPGSEYHGRFIGRPVEEIIEETASVATHEENIFERASAVGFLGLRGTLDYHTRAGAAYDAGRKEEAYRIIDEAYAKVRAGEFEPARPRTQGESITWDEIRELAEKGHEFASHTVTHPRLAVLDEPNLLYELEKSREEILNRLGPAHTFSVEGPYGTENERAVEYALDIYPASRNRMPEPFLDELNRWNRRDPRESDREYVQWQRGPLTATPLADMKSWIDTIASDDNIWLVLVFHGVDGIGWEAKPSTELREYFRYIAAHEKDVWVATFQDATKYIRERVHARVEAAREDGSIRVDLSHGLDPDLYDLPLSLTTVVPSEWEEALIKQGDRLQRVDVWREDGETRVTYEALPDDEPVIISNTPLQS